MDYSIHDAVEAGFNKIIFIIRKDIEADFREVIGNRIEAVCRKCGVEVHYAFQDIRDIPGELPEGRTKPWGTGQAVLAAKDLIHEPFIVINADDYYGKEGFRQIHDALTSGNGEHCMAGFVLKNTLSDNGGVTRGICHMKDCYLTRIKETKNIRKTPEGAEADGTAIDIDSPVSMNMWGFQPEYLRQLEQGFRDFFRKEVPENPLKSSSDSHPRGRSSGGGRYFRQSSPHRRHVVRHDLQRRRAGSSEELRQADPRRNLYGRVVRRSGVKYFYD